MYVQEGEMIARVDRRGHRFGEGDFCLIQPGELHTLEGPAHTILISAQTSKPRILAA
jgi:quercetin dioxygenase-like cupin family protein